MQCRCPATTFDSCFNLLLLSNFQPVLKPMLKLLCHLFWIHLDAHACQVLIHEDAGLKDPLTAPLDAFCRTFNMTVALSSRAVQEADFVGTINGQRVTLAELKTDVGGNSRAQVQASSLG